MKGTLSYFDAASHALGALPSVIELPKDPVSVPTGRGEMIFFWNREMATWDVMAKGCELRIGATLVQENERFPLEDQQVISADGRPWRFERIPELPSVAGRETFVIPLGKAGVVLGRRSDNPPPLENPAQLRVDLDTDDQRIARSGNASIEPSPHGWALHQIKGTTELNGRADFRSAPLLYGDRFVVGCNSFEFRGDSIALVRSIPGAEVEAVNAGLRVGGGKLILQGVTMRVARGEFIGIIGKSGMGKSTLMNALCGLGPANIGRVTIDGNVVNGPGDLTRLSVGIVPQDDVVHRELTARQAVLYSARLRFKMPRKHQEALTEGVLKRLGLAEHMDKQIGRRMSGGQRKRVGIATELLALPVMLFLDEPSSGLDPQTEMELMDLLQTMSRVNKLTVISTTHMLDNADAFNRLLIMHRSRMVYLGNNADARRHFFGQTEEDLAAGMRLRSLSNIYEVLTPRKEGDTELSSEQRDAVEESLAIDWERKFTESRRDLQDVAVPPPTPRAAAPRQARPGPLSILITLISRQWAIFKSSPLNILFLLLQAVSIGGLIGWVSDDGGFRLFLGLIASMWFGCSNAGQRIVAEMPIFRQERIAGMGIHTYIQSKFIFLSVLTSLQTMILFFCMTIAAFLFNPTDKVVVEPGADTTVVEKTSLEKFSEAMAGGTETAGRDAKTFELRSKLLEWAQGLEPNAPRPPEVSTTTPPPGNLILRLAQMTGLESNLKGSGADLVLDHPKGDKTLLGTTTEGTAPQKEALAKQIKAFRLPGKATATESISAATEADLTTFLGNGGAPLFDEGISWQEVLTTCLSLRLLALLAAAITGVAIGLAISACVENEVQAVMWVPLFLIPQILFGGHVVTEPAMSWPVRAFCKIIPSYSAEKIAEVSQLYGLRVPDMVNRTKIPSFLHPDGGTETVYVPRHESIDKKVDYERLSPVNSAWQNLVVFHSSAGMHIPSEDTKGKKDSVVMRADVSFKKGELYRDITPAYRALSILGGWTAFCYLVVYLALRKKQTKPM